MAGARPSETFRGRPVVCGCGFDFCNEEDSESLQVVHTAPLQSEALAGKEVTRREWPFVFRRAFYEGVQRSERM